NGGGGRLNDKVVIKETALAKLEDLNTEGVLKLSAGRKRHVLVIPN
ncbi:MAG: tyrosine--tRNA ligase, partial [Rickettsiales bacterium]|nr:tyrosine--tRNA ligase [Rickettsiales bacterium]